MAHSREVQARGGRTWVLMIHKDPCMKNDHLTVLFEEAGVEPVQPKLSQQV